MPPRDVLRKRLRGTVLAIVLVVLASGAAARQTTGSRFADYVGTYADAPGHTLEIADGDGLFAVLDEAKYPLRASGVDRFTTVGGQVVTFPRDASGKVTGYEQDGEFHPRVSTTITAASAALARPRPAGQGSPADYRYRPPADLHDGIVVGDIAGSDLGVATANTIVRGILAGTYKDVHGVLLAAEGNGGQKIYLVPQHELVAVFTGGGYNAESTPPNTIMAKVILPALMKAASRAHESSMKRGRRCNLRGPTAEAVEVGRGWPSQRNKGMDGIKSE